MENFKTIEESISSQIIEKKSKFISSLFYIESVEDAEKIIRQIKKKYHDARHNCYAYVVQDKDGNMIEKSSDDGEPSGTAGFPMLTILKGNELCNVLAIVTRYFGGILLGTGGLVRAYSEVTSKALEEAKIITMERGKQIKVTISYAEIENFKYYCRKNNISIVKEEYSNNVEFWIEVPNKTFNIMKKELDKKILKMTKFDIIDEKYIKTNTVI